MKMRVVVAALTMGCAFAGYTVPAHAIGCISGGLAGAVAGHMVHHGVLGAVGGCIAGHHYGKQQQLNRQTGPADYDRQSGQGSGYRGTEQPQQGGSSYRGTD